jgi:uncharacterized membrane protein YgdD (TMEM256/DUF423 family)
MDRAILVLGTLFAFTGVAAGAFGSHVLRAKLTPERLVTFETAVRYQLWHALALFAVVFVDALGPLRPVGWTSYAPLVTFRPFTLPGALAGWLFVAGILLFSGSLYALALTGSRRWGTVTPFGGFCLLAAWASLAWAILIR